MTGVLFLTVLGNGLIQYRVDTNWSRVVEGAVLVSSAGFQVVIVRAARCQRPQPTAGDPNGEATAVTAVAPRSARAEAKGEPVIEVEGATKRFGPVAALDGVTFGVRPGEVVALLGDNGAGKTTLVRALTGVHALDEGSVIVRGSVVELNSPLDAQALGIEAVHQRLGVVGIFDASENLFLGREPLVSNVVGRSIGWIDKRHMRSETAAELHKLGVRIPGRRTPVASLSGGQRQSVAVARAGRWARSIVLLDEPTAALGVQQSAEVLRLVRDLAEAGMAVLLVTHDMPQVLEVCDRFVVLRRGRVVAVEAVDEATSVERLVGLITGAVSTAPTHD
ncbi:MAG: sugar ABC transporter ATP-binding protein [Acidimicrobiia bacterium]|nr:sugar ABC transporter ATP-binding protein [Acidimicrobiia bacterium]